MPQSVTRGEFSVDPGGVTLKSGDYQRQVDDDSLANVLFNVRGEPSAPTDDRLNVRFEEFWWIEPEISRAHGLISLALLASASHLGRGVIRAELTSQEPSGSDGRSHWRVAIDLSSISGPPNYRSSGEQIRSESSRDGTAEVTVIRQHDGVVSQIDLSLPAGLPPHVYQN